MRYIKNNFMAKLLMVSLFIICLNFNINARIKANYSDDAYKDPDGVEKATISIKNYIIEGARYFLKSNSDMLFFLSKYELAELDTFSYEDAKSILDSVIINMQKSNGIYYQLKEIASTTPYNTTVIEKLIVFDYNYLREYQGLNQDIFRKVESLLSKGDVTGIYVELYKNTYEILNELLEIREIMGKEKMDILPNLWRINKLYSESLLFGQYVAQVFYEIKDKL